MSLQGILYPFPPDGVGPWRGVGPAAMGFQQHLAGGQLPAQGREDTNYSPIYPQPTFSPSSAVSYPASSLNMPGYTLGFNGQYSPASMMMPASPSPAYSSQEYLSPWINSGDISSTPTTPLTMQPMPCAPQEPSIMPTHLAQVNILIVFQITTADDLLEPWLDLSGAGQLLEESSRTSNGGRQHGIHSPENV